jgi:hypothetical protein
VFGPQDILRPPRTHAADHFATPVYRTPPDYPQLFSIYIKLSCARVCGCQTGFACLSTPRFGVRKAPPDEAHTRSRFSLILYFRACAPGNVFRHGHGHIRGTLTSPLGLLLRPGGSAPVRTCKLQSSVMAYILDGEGETLRLGTPDGHI